MILRKDGKSTPISYRKNSCAYSAMNGVNIHLVRVGWMHAINEPRDTRRIAAVRWEQANCIARKSVCLPKAPALTLAVSPLLHRMTRNITKDRSLDESDISTKGVKGIYMVMQVNAGLLLRCH